MSRKRTLDISWDGRRKKWKDQEVIAIINLIKKHNLLEHDPTDAQLGETLTKPMNDLGYNRTAHQIKLKMKSLRKSYAQCKSGNLESFKDCVFYDLLDSLYSQMESKDLDSDDESGDTENDSMIWSESGLDRLLMIIKELDLGHELSVGNVSINLLRKVHKALLSFNINKTLDQIKMLLQNLKNTYANCKRKLEDGSLEFKFPYFEQLDDIWREEYENGYFHTDDGYDEFWSEEETILLLEALKDTNPDYVSDDFIRTSKVEEYLNDSGYRRTKIQILKRIENLKQNYAAAKKCKTLNEAIIKFPFYHSFDQVFRRENPTDAEPYEENNLNEEDASEEGEDSIGSEKKKHVRGYIWVEEEISVLLNLVKELNLINIFRGRMKLECVTRLVAPLAALGFERTAWQIKLKLKGLRNQYYRYIKSRSVDDNSEKCPYFDEINEMVQILDQSDAKVSKSNESLTAKMCKNKKREAILKNIQVDEDDQNFNKGLFESPVLNHPDDFNARNHEIVIWESLETIPDQDNFDDKSDDRLSDMFEEVFEEEDNGFESSNTDKNQILVKSEQENLQECAEFVKIPVRNLSLCSIENCSLLDKKVNDVLLNDKTLDSLETRDNNTVISECDDTQLLESCSSKLDKPLTQDTTCAARLQMINQNGSKPLSTNDVLMQVLKHEKLLQHQHHLWLEKHFEKQRKHDSEIRKELMNELQQLRSAIISDKKHLD